MNATPTHCRILYVSAPCGSGKTYSTCQHINEHRHIRNHMYIAPTKVLIEETAKELRKLGIEPKVITSDYCNSNVTKTLVDYLLHCEERGAVLLITFSAYISLPYFNRQENWNVVIDEVPQLDSFHPLDLHQNPNQIFKNIVVDEPINDFILPVSARNVGRLRKLLENPDDVTKKFAPFFRDVLNPNKDVFVDAKSWNKFEAEDVSHERDSNRIYFLSLLNPTAFQGVTLLGANIEESLLYDWFSRYHGAEFTPHEEIIQTLRFTKHDVSTGSRVRISYLLPDRGHSKYQMNQKFTDGTTWSEKYDIIIERHFDGESFLYAANNDYEGSLIELSNAERISVVSHGLNTYDMHTRIYFEPALNRQPQHQGMLNNLGLSRETIKNSTVHECAYQSIMRTALRNPDSNEVIDVVVPEKETADRLAEIFDGAEMKWIGDDEFKKVPPLSPTERKRRTRCFATEKLLLETSNDTLQLGCVKCKSTNLIFLPRRGNEFLLSNKEKCTHCGAKLGLDDLLNKNIPMSAANASEAGTLLLTFHKNRYNKSADDYHVELLELQDFIKILRESSKNILNSKDESFMINPAVFNGTDPEGHRRKVNFHQSSMMILDFDDGDMTIEDFERIFWHEAGRTKRSFIICNSFSRSESQPNRFRVFMLYKNPAMSLDEHQAVYDSVVKRLKENGFTAKPTDRCKLSGIDSVCRNGTQSFYMPCTNRTNPEYTYFAQFGTKSREVERHGIDPSLVLKTTVRPSVKPQLSIVKTDRKIRNVEEVNTLIEAYKDDVRTLTEGRHKPFFLCGVKLRGLGLSNHEIEQHLTMLETDIGKHGEHWAREAMRSLEQSRLKVAA